MDGLFSKTDSFTERTYCDKVAEIDQWWSKFRMKDKETVVSLAEKSYQINIRVGCPKHPANRANSLVIRRVLYNRSLWKKCNCLEKMLIYVSIIQASKEIKSYNAAYIPEPIMG